MKARSVKEAICDREFWNQINDLLMIFKPIHNAQKSSENTKSTVAHVVPRWNEIEAILTGLTSTIPELASFMAPNGGFQACKAIQSTELHKAAFWLDPRFLNHTLQEPEKTSIIKWMLLHLNDADNDSFLRSFWQFRSMRNEFNISNISWLSKDDPITYWTTYLGDHKVLASFAIRLFELICNAVLSERAWSVMNLIQTPIRGNLSSDKSTKMAYISI